MKKESFPELGCPNCPSLSGQYNNRMCKGGKRPRRFRSGDPTIKAPSWCPKRLSPAAIRVYRLKDEQAEFFHYSFHHETKVDGTSYAYPQTHHYMKVHEERQSVTAKSFYEASLRGEAFKLDGFDLVTSDVIEIDSGLSQVYFYFKGYRDYLIAMFTPPKSTSNKEGEYL